VCKHTGRQHQERIFSRKQIGLGFRELLKPTCRGSPWEAGQIAAAVLTMGEITVMLESPGGGGLGIEGPVRFHRVLPVNQHCTQSFKVHYFICSSQSLMSECTAVAIIIL
jgi:hypothetical protein